MPLHLVGASVWDQELYDHFVSHAEHESELIDEYRRMAADTESDDVRYLLGLIIDDEIRHHQVIDEMARTLRAHAETADGQTPVPTLAFRHSDAAAVLGATRRFYRLEREDRRELRRLGRRLRHRRDSSLRPLLARIMLADTEKHLMILRFLRRQLLAES